MKRFGIATSGLMMIDGKALCDYNISNRGIDVGHVGILDRYFDDFCQVILNDLFSDDRWRSMSVSTYCGDPSDSNDPSDGTFVFDVWFGYNAEHRAHVRLMHNEPIIRVRIYRDAGIGAPDRYDVPLARYNGELVGVISMLLGPG